MTVVIGLPRDERATAAMHLGGLLARSLGEDVVVCTVVPRAVAARLRPGRRRVPGVPRPGRRPTPWTGPASCCRPTSTAQFEVARARSTSAGLLEVAQQHGAGHAGARLVHRRGARAGRLRQRRRAAAAQLTAAGGAGPARVPGPAGQHRVTEVTAAFGATEGADELVVAVAGVAARVGATLRIASFAVRPRTPLTAGIGSRAEDSVLNVWGADVERAQQRVLAEVEPAAARAGHGVAGDRARHRLGRGAGGHRLGRRQHPGRRVELGRSAGAGVPRLPLVARSSGTHPVPVVVLPRGATHELADPRRDPLNRGQGSGGERRAVVEGGASSGRRRATAGR